MPAPVLAEAWRGGSRQASLSRLLAMCEVEDVSAQQARHVGVLAGMAAHDDIVDVTVVEGAVRRGDAVVTSNDTHIRLIAGAANARLHIETSDARHGHSTSAPQTAERSSVSGRAALADDHVSAVLEVDLEPVGRHR